MRAPDPSTLAVGPALVDPALVDVVDRLHAAVDALTAPLALRHAARLRCRRGCSGCCVDDLTVFEVEAAAIVRKHGALLREGRAARAGACAFLDDAGGCRIYEERPYVCRTQGLPLRWLDEVDGEVHELRDICALNAEGEPLEALPDDACWSLGPVEAKLAELQAKHDGGAGRRVALRELFGSSDAARDR